MNVTFVMRPDGNLFRGGAELMVERTKAELEKFGCQVDILTPLTTKLGDIVHFFGSYDSHWSTASIAIGQGKPYICTPIFSTSANSSALHSKALRHKLTRRFPRLQYKLLNNAAAIAVQTEREKQRLTAYFGSSPEKVVVVPHGVEERFTRGDPQLFRSHYGIEGPFVISTGAYLTDKNRLNLIRAMNGSDVRLVIAGTVVDAPYFQTCKGEAASNVTLLESIPHESELLPSAYAAAQSFSLPSYNETFCMAAMEAAVASCPLVLGNTWEAEEIYGRYAELVDPDDVSAIKTATLQAFGKGKQPEAQAKYFLQRYRWDVVTRQLLEVYECAMKN